MNCHLRTVALSFAILATISCLCHAAEENRPNILVIMCDDLGYADVGFNGSIDIPTPSIDRLANRGTIFSSAYAAHPFCGPSRAGLLSGRYPHEFGAQFNLPERGPQREDGIPVDELLIGDVLQKAGYFTGLIGKWHLGAAAPFHPNRRGFDEFFGFLGGGHRYFPSQYQPEYEKQKLAGNQNIWDYLTPLEHNGREVQETEYITDALSRESVRFIDEAARNDQPFFLFVSFNAPHTPLEAKAEDLQRVTAIEDPDRRTYAAMVHAVDRGVAKIVAALESSEQLNQTLIVFLSDNGGRTDAGASNAPLRGVKGDTYEGGFRVPMFFHWPSHVPKGQRFEHPVSALDLFPTFSRLGRAKLPADNRLAGYDIWDNVLTGTNPRQGKTIYALRHRKLENEIGARRDQWKLFRSRNDRPWQLFNVSEDIGERDDLSQQYPDRVQSMVADVRSWCRSHVQPRWFNSNEESRFWKTNGMPYYEEAFQLTAAAEPSASLQKSSDQAPSDRSRSTNVIRQENANRIYFEDFETDPGYVGAKGPNDNNISSISFGIGGSKSPLVKLGQFAGTSQYAEGTAITGSTSHGQFSIGSNQRVFDKSRNRCYLTFIDTSNATAGQYNVSFDVSEFQSSDGGTSIYVHLYEGSDCDSGYLNFQVTHQSLLPKFVPNGPGIEGQGGKIASILLDNEVTGNGRFSLNFGLSETGEPGDFLGLVWAQVKRGGTAPMPSMTIDNIEVSRLPATHLKQPTDEQVTASPAGQTGDWQLLPDVSDEFDSSEVNLQKWNTNPARYGAATWDEKNAFQDAGNLHLQLVHEPHVRSNTKLFYKSGVVRSHKQMTYGYYEARIKGCRLFPGACPAFWIFSDGRKYDGEVRYCEIDFVELQMNELNHETQQRNPVNFIDMNLHLRLAEPNGQLKWVRPDSHPQLCANQWIAPWDPRDDFHVYGCDVTPEKITWYIDGKQVATKPNQYWHLPMNVALTLELRHPHIGWQGQTIFPVPQNATETGFPTTMKIDYVRVWEKK